MPLARRKALTFAVNFPRDRPTPSSEFGSLLLCSGCLQVHSSMRWGLEGVSFMRCFAARMSNEEQGWNHDVSMIMWFVESSAGLVAFDFVDEAFEEGAMDVRGVFCGGVDEDFVFVVAVLGRYRRVVVVGISVRVGYFLKP